MVVNRFLRAWVENRDLALRILFYARDIRGGLGERRVFRTVLRWLAQNEPASVKRNLSLIPEFGRWDDVLVLMETPCEGEVVALIRTQLAADLRAMEAQQPVSLLAKWLPSVNTSNPETVRMGRRVARALGMTDQAYRQTLSRLRAAIQILENNLRQRDYSFDYAKQTSGAMFRYRKAFIRNDGDRYRAYLARVAKGNETLHTDTLMPYELVRRAVSGLTAEERQSLDVTWNALPDYTHGENALVVVDGSDSMTWGGNPRPIDVAVSLGMYFAERNTGAFHNHFITFSMTPRLVEIKGEDFVERVRYCRTYNECAYTNLQAVFELILRAAVAKRLPQEQLPSTLYIITDMEFDFCTENASMTNFEAAKALFARHGYKLPNVVFWDVQSRNEQQPVQENEQGVALVSGASAQIFSMAMTGDLNPYNYMMQVLAQERYMRVFA